MPDIQMLRTTDLEKQARAVLAKAEEERKNGKYNPMNFITVDPDEVVWMEMIQSPYRGWIDCAKCEVSLGICKHNPLMNGTIERPKYVAPVEVEPEPKAPRPVKESFQEESEASKVRREAKTFTAEQKQAVVDAYLTPMTTAKVSEITEVPINYVYKILHEANVMRPKGTKVV